MLIDLFGTLVPSSIDFSHVRKLACDNRVPVREFKDAYDQVLLTRSFPSPEVAVSVFCSKFGTPKKERDRLTQYLGDRWARRDNHVRFFPEVEKTLSTLKKRGYALALVSNAECFGAEIVRVRAERPECASQGSRDGRGHQADRHPGGQAFGNSDHLGEPRESAAREGQARPHHPPLGRIAEDFEVSVDRRSALSKLFFNVIF